MTKVNTINNLAYVTDVLVARWVQANTTNAIQIRDYQVEAWLRLWTKRQANYKARALIHLATGLGKTSVAAVDVLHYLRVENPGAKVLFVSHMSDISYQAELTFKHVDPGFTTSFLRAGKLKDVDITFATFQGLHRHLQEIDPSRFAYIIWDEAHHIEADTFSEVREHFNPDFELGLTATPERADGLDILEYFGSPLLVKSLADGIAEGWLSAVDYHILFDDAVKEAMNNSFQINTIRQIRELFSVRARNEMIAKNVMEHRHAIGLDLTKTIVFTQNVKMAGEMAKLLGGEAYHSGVNKDDRLDILKRFRTGKLKVICTVDMFNEGIDIPDARLIVFLRSTSSRTVFEQQLGRGLRRAENKDLVTILDFVANVERIDFVRDLGHTISRARKAIGIRESAGLGQASHAYSSGAVEKYFDLTHFEFEDQTIQLLERFNDLKNREYLDRDMIVTDYQKMKVKSVPRLARKYGVSSTAVYKHLKKAGIDTSGLTRKDLTIDVILESYNRLGSIRLVGEELNVGSTTILTRFKQAGIPIERTPQKYTDEQVAEAYMKCDRNLRATSRLLNQDRNGLGRRLRKIGFDLSRKVINPEITKEQLEASYQKHNGNLLNMVEDFECSRGIMWTKLYKALDKYGYLENWERPLTSAVASAAYYKFGSSTKAGKYLGVSSTLIIRLSKRAKFIPKYGRGKKLKKGAVK